MVAVLNYIFLMLGMMISIPFLTLVERKVLGLIQFRKGPKKTSLLGILQPMFDGIKLMIKDSSFLPVSNWYFFKFSALFSFLMMILLWMKTSFPKSSISLNNGLILIMMFSSLNVYSLMSSGWSSKSKYSLLGSIRGASQVMSYEVSLLFYLFLPLIFCFSLKIWNFKFKSCFSMLFFFFLIFIWLIIIVAETKRSPFDFAEGESELVSGFNIEYGSLLFAFLFLGEYGSMIWICFFSTVIFLPLVFFIFLIFLVIWFRGSFPRFRYDFLMSLAWKVILPIGLIYFFFLFFLF